VPDFHLVPAPVFSPTRCVTCGTTRCDEGFIDLIVETASLGFNEHADAVHDPAGLIPTLGHLYQCVLCVRQAANAAGCLDPGRWADLRADHDAALDRLEALEGELEAEKQNKVVSLADVLEMRKTDETSPKPKAAA
jgi:hypothetical protein